MEELSLYIVTFNCARNVIHREQFSTHLLDVLPPSKAAPELLVLNLQEVAPIGYAFLGGSFLAHYFDALNAAVNAAAQVRWTGGEVKYVNLVTHNSGLTALLVFARSDVAGDIAWIDTAEVGVGVHEMGNKGAVGARLGYTTTGRANETVDLTFVAAHIAPMEDAYDQRNQDWRSIVERLVFTNPDNTTQGVDAEEGRDDDVDEDAGLLLRGESSTRQSSMFTPRSHLFFAGDLNYRTSDSPPSPEDYARFPQPDAHFGDPIHHSQLFAKDQLTRELRAQNTLHGLSEAPIEFPPTYKYSSKAQKATLVGGDQARVWQWAKHRWPSWCDRILYLDLPPWMKDSNHVNIHGYDALPLFSTSDHRAVALAVSVPLKPIPRPPSPSSTDDVRLHPPFSIDPNWKAKRATARTKEIIIGGLSYLALTREGNGFLLAGTISLIGCWFVLQSLLLGDM
ncbi:hypothetical protein PISL3812_04187 [Talaromyces islandicus]|uniref:Inositol polyphosphate-related phosphatase domain-containing protein n=1 Tax=Talaromyces islandicus TaxID=28573 RepID=A0A0U1LX57_TALIS|nr:hypothetical protein PISL3812_04187 [Talaromyces islandicus]